MTQSSLLVGLLAAAFLLYVAAKGRLPAYTAVLWGPTSSGSGSGGKGGPGASSPDWLSIGETILETAVF